MKDTEKCKHDWDILEKSKICIICGEVKRLKPQGKISVPIVIKGILENKKRKDIAVEAGSIAKSDKNKCLAVKQVMQSKRYKEEAKPYLDRLEDERDRAMEALTEIDPKSIDYDKLVKSLEIMTKQIELLQGNVTERTEVDVKDIKEFLNNA